MTRLTFRIEIDCDLRDQPHSFDPYYLKNLIRDEHDQLIKEGFENMLNEIMEKHQLGKATFLNQLCYKVRFIE